MTPADTSPDKLADVFKAMGEQLLPTQCEPHWLCDQVSPDILAGLVQWVGIMVSHSSFWGDWCSSLVGSTLVHLDNLSIGQ